VQRAGRSGAATRLPSSGLLWVSGQIITSVNARGSESHTQLEPELSGNQHWPADDGLALALGLHARYNGDTKEYFIICFIYLFDFIKYLFI
jgi:hypothetical protein